MNRRWLSLSVGLLALALAVVYLLRQREALLAVSSGLNWVAVLPMFPLVLFMRAVNGLSLALFTRPFGVVLKPIEWFGIAVATSFANYIAPFSAGLIARAGYLKSRHALPYARFLVLTAAQNLIAICLAGLLGFGLTISAWPILHQTGLPLVVFFALTALGMFVLMLLPLDPARFNRLPMGDVVSRALEGWKVIKRNTRLLVAQAVLTSVLLVALGLTLYFAFKAIGVTVTLVQAILLGVLLSLSMLVRVTPGNLGLQEVFLGVIAPLTGIPTEAGLAAALVMRGVVITAVFSLGPPASYFLARHAERATHAPGLNVGFMDDP